MSSSSGYFEEKRIHLATNEWKRSRRASPQHMEGFDKGMTCIDCQKGIANQMPDISSLTDEERKELNLE